MDLHQLIFQKVLRTTAFEKTTEWLLLIKVKSITAWDSFPAKNFLQTFDVYFVMKSYSSLFNLRITELMVDPLLVFPSYNSIESAIRFLELTTPLYIVVASDVHLIKYYDKLHRGLK